MPTDIPMTSGNRREARRLHNFCDPGHNQESIEEETETVDVQKEHFAKEDDEKFDHSPQVNFVKYFFKVKLRYDKVCIFSEMGWSGCCSTVLLSLFVAV